MEGTENITDVNMAEQQTALDGELSRETINEVMQSIIRDNKELKQELAKVREQLLYGNGRAEMDKQLIAELREEVKELNNTVASKQRTIETQDHKIKTMQKPQRHFTKCFNAECYRLLTDKRFTLKQRGIILSLSCLVRGYGDTGKISFIEGQNLVNPKTKGSITSWKELAECLNLSKTDIERPKKALKFLEDNGVISTWEKGKKVILFFTKDDTYFSATRG